MVKRTVARIRVVPCLRPVRFNLKWPVVALLNIVLVLAIVTMCPQRARSLTMPEPLNTADCDAKDPHKRFDVIIVGAGLAGLSAAKELSHLGYSVLILERNERIGGRAYAATIGDASIDYGGAWIHSVSTNPLTALVDSMQFTRERTELDLPYFIDSSKANKEEKDKFDEAVKEYEDAVALAAKAVEDQHALAEFACRESRKKEWSQRDTCRHLEGIIPFTQRPGLLALCASSARSPEEFCTTANKYLRVTSDVAKSYMPSANKFQDIIPLLIANAGPLESAAELSKTSAVDGAYFANGEDDLVKQGMGVFVEKFGDGLPVCLKSSVASVNYAMDGVQVKTDDGRAFHGSYAVVTVSVGVLKKRKITFIPELPEDKLQAIDRLQMGNMQKVIIPLSKDIFPDELPNSWILYEGKIANGALEFAHDKHLPLVQGDRVVMAFVIKPLKKDIAIGFFGGDWAKALEGRCDHLVSGSGAPNLNCDNLSIAITKSALSSIAAKSLAGENIDKYIQNNGIRITHWSLDATSLGAYSVAEPGDWYQREILAEPVEDTEGLKRLFFAGEGTSRAIYNGSYPGAYESGIKAAREIHVAEREAKEKTGKPGR